MNSNLSDLVWDSGLMAQGTPDSWDMDALNKFGLSVARKAIQIALDADDPFTAIDIANYFGIED